MTYRAVTTHAHSVVVLALRRQQRTSYVRGTIVTGSTNHGDEERGGQRTESRLADPTWPRVSLRYAFNPDLESIASSDPDELVVFEPGSDGPGERWMTAERGSYERLEDAR